MPRGILTTGPPERQNTRGFYCYDGGRSTELAQERPDAWLKKAGQ